MLGFKCYQFTAVWPWLIYFKPLSSNYSCKMEIIIIFVFISIPLVVRDRRSNLNVIPLLFSGIKGNMLAHVTSICHQAWLDPGARWCHSSPTLGSLSPPPSQSLDSPFSCVGVLLRLALTIFWAQMPISSFLCVGCKPSSSKSWN